MIAEAELDRMRLPGRYYDVKVNSRFGTLQGGIHGIFAMYDMIGDTILRIRMFIFVVVQAEGIGFIFTKQGIGLFFIVQERNRYIFVLNTDGIIIYLVQYRFIILPAPAPGIAKPGSGQYMQAGRFRPPVVNGYFNQYIIGACLGIFHQYIKIFVFIEEACIQYFKFFFLAGTSAIFLHQPFIRKFLLRILVQHFHIGMGRRGI